jgi:group I intron endonuclease
MRISSIYKIQSIIKPEREYVGSAIDIKNRWNLHLYKLRKNSHHSVKLQNHYNKYGESDLVFIIIEPCFPEFLTTREQYYLDKLKPYFNLCKIANSKLGIKISVEGCKNISKGHVGHLVSEETRLKISMSNKGRISPNKGVKMSEEQKIKIGNKNKGKQPNLGTKYTDEAKLKISISKKGKPLTIEHKNRLSESHLRYWGNKKLAK